MPILKRELDITPGLFEMNGEWQLAHVRPRKEKALARYLTEDDGGGTIGYYLPQLEKRAKSGGRMRISYLPLFPGYLFFRGEAGAGAEARRAVLRSGMAAQIVHVDDQQLFERELRQIHELQEKGLILVPCPDLTEGDAVQIREGAFAGFRGWIVRRANGQRLVVALTILNRNLEVEFEKEQLTRPAEARKPGRLMEPRIRGNECRDVVRVREAHAGGNS